MWRALLRIGAAGNINDTTENQGVYTFGATNERYTDSLSFDYVISTGNYNGNVRIGLVFVVNGKLLIGWQDGVACGVDYVDISNPCYPDGTVEMLVEDDGAMYHEKEAVTATAQFKPLAAGQSCQLKYKLNRADNWTTMPAVTTTSESLAREVIVTNGSRYREYEVGLNLATTTGVSPTVRAISVEKDDLATEQRVS